MSIEQQVRASALLLALALASATLPATAAARWSRVSATSSNTQPYLACPSRPHRLACQLIEDPIRGTARRGPVPAGAITAGPEAEVSPALFGHGVEGGYSPEDLRAAYAMPSISAGAGQTVAVVDAFDDPRAESDLAEYRSQYGLPQCTAANACFRKVNQLGGNSYPAPEAGWAGEISLDLDMVSAICPNCHLLLVEADDNLAKDLAAGENEAAALGASEISNSFGGREQSEPAAIASAFVHPGIPITAAGGDHGYGVNSPASNPHVIAVGGTSLSPAANARGWTESVWYGVAEGELWGTGSGCSAEAKPPWQADSGCAERTTNDVAAVADQNTPVSVYDSYQTAHPWRLYSGTSVATPIVAAAMALSDPNTKSLDGAQPMYLEAAANGTAALNDVTSGSNGACGSYLCEAGPGYDGPSGLGSLRGPPQVSPSAVHPPTVVTEPASVVQSSATLHATVNPNGQTVTRCAFQYGSSEAYTPCAQLPGSGESPVSVSASVSGLIAGATYYFRIVAANASGTSYGNLQAMTLPPAASPAAPAPVPAQGVLHFISPARPAPVVTLASASATVSPRGAVGVTLRCPRGESACIGRVTLRTLAALSVATPGGAAARRVLTLASGSFAIPGGQTRTVVLRLSARARALLARSRVLRVRVTVLAHDPAGAAHTVQSILTLRARRASRR